MFTRSSRHMPRILSKRTLFFATALALYGGLVHADVSNSAYALPSKRPGAWRVPLADCPVQDVRKGVGVLFFLR